MGRKGLGRRGSKPRPGLAIHLVYVFVGRFAAESRFTGLSVGDLLSREMDRKQLAKD